MPRSFLALKTILGNSNAADCISHWTLFQDKRGSSYSLPILSATPVSTYMFYSWALPLFPEYSLSACTGNIPFASSNPFSPPFLTLFFPVGDQRQEDKEISVFTSSDSPLLTLSLLHPSTKDHSSCRAAPFIELPTGGIMFL